MTVAGAKKIPAVVFVILMIIFICACANDNADKNSGGENTTGASQETAENAEEISGKTDNPDFTDALPALNFNGKVFTFLVEPEPAFHRLYDVNVDGEIGEIVNDTIYQRNRAVEDRLGIVIKDVTDDNAQKTILNSVAAGDTNYNGVWLKVDNFFTASLAGAFLDLHTVPNLNLEKKYWDQNAVSDMTISGRLYGMTGDITTATHSFTHLLMFNKSLAADYGLPNIYNLVREGKWTFDVFEEITKNIYKDLNGNGKTDVEDFYSVYITPAAYEAFFSSAGEKWIEKNSDGEIIFSDLTEKKISVLEKIESLFAKKEYVWCGYEQPQPFNAGRAIFYESDIGIASYESRDIGFDFGIVPLPKFSEQQDRYYVYAYPFFPFLSIPAAMTGEDVEMAGAVLEALASESYKTLTPAFYDIALQSKFLRDEESYEMLDIILRSRIYDILYWGQWDSFRNWNTGLVSAMQKGVGGYVSVYEKNIEAAKIKINEIVDIYANLGN